VNLIDLSGPFPAAQISWRVGATSGDKSKGIALAYLNARDVMDRLDVVCGLAGWQAEYPWSDGKRIVCSIGIKVESEWVWKANGCGETDIEAEKGAMSDAFKRAAVLWGIGRYLYDVPNIWVPLVAAGRSYKFDDATKKDLTNRLAIWQANYFKKV
jgi:hypothetical protein